jgi:hypothetical protein
LSGTAIARVDQAFARISLKIDANACIALPTLRSFSLLPELTQPDGNAALRAMGRMRSLTEFDGQPSRIVGARNKRIGCLVELAQSMKAPYEFQRIF